MKWILLFLAAAASLFARPYLDEELTAPYFDDELTAPYLDDELKALWASIPDLERPTMEDYKAIDGYLELGKRPYLKPLYDSLEEMEPAIRSSYERRLHLIRNFKLVGEEKWPLFEKHCLQTEDGDLDRCVLLYGSQNGIYPEKTWMLLNELKKCGYRGHVFLRIGGFPNTPNGGLKICQVPYSFKAAFLKEAQLLGYKNVLWLDTALHPLTNLDSVFDEIESNGYFLTCVGTLEDNAFSHLPAASEALQLDPLFYPQIKHLSSSLIGLNFSNENSASLLNLWLETIEQAFPNSTWFPEELSLAAAAWRTGCLPHWSFGDVVCAQNELDQIYNRFDLQFFLDTIR